MKPAGFVTRERNRGNEAGRHPRQYARGAMVDEAAMIEALKSGHIRHAGLDVFNIEPLPADHPLTKLPNVTLSAHSAFRTPEASENLIHAAWEHWQKDCEGRVGWAKARLRRAHHLSTSRYIHGGHAKFTIRRAFARPRWLLPT